MPYAPNYRNADPGSVMAHVIAHGTDKTYVPVRPALATAASPGSRAKVDILAFRAAQGCDLFHPLDRNCFDEWRDL